jgi:deoxyribodipyrimidine photolyase
MDVAGKILFWFRDPELWKEGSEAGLPKIDCSELIPIYCFDPREGQLIKKNDFHYQQSLKVYNLRNQLQQRGSNLLVVYHYYESIIPSIARVLNVTRVMSHEVEKQNTNIPVSLAIFRDQKLNEVRFLLDMHSIPLELESSRDTRVPDIFPAFPSINPGVIRI